jgi:nucleotide-binding universal stress UspA family protein
MAKKILLAVDNSKNSLKAVKYVATTVNTDASVTLLSILPDPAAACEMDSPSLTPVFKKNAETFCSIEDTKKQAMEKFMDEAKKILVKAGFPSKNLASKIRKKKAGVARDILKAAEQGQYDTIVIGRRGLSGIKQFMFGSVSNKVVQLAETASVIVVD